MRYIPIDNDIQQHGRAWRSGEWQGMAVYGWCCVYIGIQIAWRQSRTEARYTNATRCILVYDIRYANTVYTRHRQTFATPGCVYRVRACVRYIIILLYYYNIIILLYLYIPNISSISSISSIPNIPNISNDGNIAL